MYGFDSTRIYLQGNFGGMLINAKTDLVTDYNDLFRNVTPIQGLVGSGIIKIGFAMLLRWKLICSILLPKASENCLLKKILNGIYHSLIPGRW